MAVDDHGIEALRKAADEVTPGSKANYVLKVRDAYNAPKLSPPSTADYCSVDRSTTKTEIFTYKSGGASGTILRTLTIVYNDEARTIINTITSVDP